MSHPRRPKHPPESPTESTSDDVDYTVELLLEEVAEDPDPKPLQYNREIRGRTVIITGGATGIGRAIALEFARCGAKVAFNFFGEGESGERIRQAAIKTAGEIAQMEARLHYEECDVRSPTQVRGFVERVREELGAPHILVNNAGIARDRALWRLSSEDWDDVLSTNLTGAFLMIREVAPDLRRAGDGKIVNIASVHGIRSEFGLANYSASKAGLIGLTRSAAIELGPSNVNVNAIAPGYIRTTRLTDGVPAEILDRARDKAVLGRLGDPQDVANVAIFLCSEYARHITGVVIPVNGGHLL